MQVDQHLPRAQRADSAMVVQQRAQDRLQLRHVGGGFTQCRAEGRRVVQRTLQCDPSGAGQAGSLILVVDRDEAALGGQRVPRIGVQRSEREGLRVERRQEADLAQQDQFERAKGGFQRFAMLRREHRDRRGIRVEKLRMRVVARQQADQEFVEVVAGEQRVAGGHDLPADPFRAFQRADLRVAAEGNVQGLQRQQHGAEVGTGPLRPFRDERHAAVMAREDFEDQARLAPVVAVQHERRFVRNPLRRSHAYS